MSEHFKDYIDKIVNELECDQAKRLELEEEFKSHLEDLRKEFIEQGHSNEESIKLAIQTFGDHHEIQKDLQYAVAPYQTIYRILGVLGGLSIVIFYALVNYSLESSIPAGVDLYEGARVIGMLIAVGLTGLFIYLSFSQKQMIQQIIAVLGVLLIFFIGYFIYATEANEIGVKRATEIIKQKISSEHQVEKEDIQIIKINDSLFSGLYIFTIKLPEDHDVTVEMDDTTGDIGMID